MNTFDPQPASSPVPVGTFRRLLLFLVILVAALAVARPSMAQEPSPAPLEREPVRVDGRTIFRVGPSAELDAAARADRVTQRLAALLENPASIAPAIIEPVNDNERVITVSGVPIVTVSATDAEDNLTTVNDLAVQWARAINLALQSGQERRRFAGGQAPVFTLIDAAFARLSESISTVAPRVLAAALVILFFGLIASAIRWLMHRSSHRFIKDRTTKNLVRQVVFYSIWVLGIVVAINALGFEPQTVATGIGLTSLALGFALQDILSNFVSGILILLIRPFKLGDQIIVGDTEGDVERIELRATQIRTYDGRLILVPNAQIFTSRVTNNTAAPMLRGAVLVFLHYGVDIGQALSTATAAAQKAPGVLAEPNVFVQVVELNKDGVILEVRYWTKSRRAEFIQTTSHVRHTVLAALKASSLLPPNGAPIPVAAPVAARPAADGLHIASQ